MAWYVPFKGEFISLLIGKAVFFTFCETLLLLGEVSNIQRHHRRLQKEAQNICLISEELVGLYEDFIDEQEDLFNRMPSWLSSANPVSELEQFFNQESRTVSMIYCLRVRLCISRAVITYADQHVLRQASYQRPYARQQRYIRTVP